MKVTHTISTVPYSVTCNKTLLWKVVCCQTLSPSSDGFCIDPIDRILCRPSHVQAATNRC